MVCIRSVSLVVDEEEIQAIDLSVMAAGHNTMVAFSSMRDRIPKEPSINKDLDRENYLPDEKMEMIP